MHKLQKSKQNKNGIKVIVECTIYTSIHFSDENIFLQENVYKNINLPNWNINRVWNTNTLQPLARGSSELGAVSHVCINIIKHELTSVRWRIVFKKLETSRTTISLKRVWKEKQYNIQNFRNFDVDYFCYVIIIIIIMII